MIFYSSKWVKKFVQKLFVRNEVSQNRHLDDADLLVGLQLSAAVLAQVLGGQCYDFVNIFAHQKLTKK
jgi:hypothetical protein